MRKICSGCRDGIDFDIPFTMAFQPIVDTMTGRPFAYEALIRGLEGEGAYSVLSQVTQANRYSFDQACRVKAIETAMAAGIMDGDARLSINFLPNAVYSPMACIQLTLRTAQAEGLPIDRLIFEFTENEEMGSPEHVGGIIDTYKSPTHNSSFAIRRVIRLMDAMTSHASEEAMEASQSLARRRHRLSHAMVRSTTHRRGRTTKRWASERLTISMASRSICAIAVSSFGPA